MKRVRPWAAHLDVGSLVLIGVAGCGGIQETTGAENTTTSSTTTTGSTTI